MSRSRLHPTPIPAGAALALALLLSAHPVQAVREPLPEPLHAAVLAPAGFVATPAPQPLAEVAGELHPLVAAAYDSFAADHGSGWRFHVDRRSGVAALAEGPGVPWVSAGGATLADLELRARDLVRRYPGMFAASNAQLVLDAAASRRFGEDGQFWNLVFHQRIAGVPVAGSAVVFRIGHGNLVQFGAVRVLPGGAELATVTPALSAADVLAAAAAHVGGLLPDDVVTEAGELLWVPRGAGDDVGWSGPVGAGWTPELVYRVSFLRAGSAGSWTALVDALTGEVLRFTDGTDYVNVLKASVYPTTNCADPADCVPGSATEVPVTLPDADLLFSDGSTGFTNSAGAFDYPPLAVTAVSTLQGRYFTTLDLCGPITVTGVGVQPDLDAGTTRLVPPPLNTDCVPADSESPPGTGPITGGLGDTHSARGAYYHLNLINQKSRFYLPHNDWLKGADGSLGPTNLLTDGPPACNAFWQGGTQTLAFFRQTPGLACNNTGEIAGVFLHEFGHGLDQHDATGTAPESATGEAMGDTFALLQTQQSCVGTGFRLPDPLDPDWGATAGYGSRSKLCSGVRDMDYTRFCRIGTGPDCGPVADPDEANGSRSGPNPPPEPAGEFGTPARWNHMLHTGITPGAADGNSNFYNCGGPETTGCAGPLDHGCHCESLIASQSNWDLAKALIQQTFGGDPYADPQGPVEVSGWQYMDRLWYLTRDLAISGYSVTGTFPAGTTNGCTVTDWFSTYRFIDDDDGDLSNGTPHADRIFEAFDLHATACGAAGDPSNQAGGCGAPLPAPTLGAACGSAPVQLEWSGVPGATRFRVLRNTLGCGFGFTPLAEVGGSRDYFEDAEVAPGVAYYYSVQPVGASASCYGLASNCVAITPSECSAPGLPAPAGVSLDNSVDNQIGVSWNAVAGAQSYKVLRRDGGCASAEPERAVGFTAAPATSFTDADGIVGGRVYGYRVAASDAGCAACVGAASACVEVEATGACELAPLFDGVRAVSSATDGTCALNVSWDDGSARCGSEVVYDVHRSTDPDFVPGAGTLVAGGLTATSFTDFEVAGGTRHFYIVRARDAFGNADANTVRRYEVPVGALSPGSFADDAGDTGDAALLAAFPPQSQWAVRADDAAGGNPTRVYATSAAGNYADNLCSGLETPTLRLGADPTLSFRTRYDIEQGWDGGIVQVATEGSGFSDWTRLDSAPYPGVMSGPLGDPACGIPEFDDLQPVFTGTAVGWEPLSATLADYAGQTVRLRFLFSSDGSANQAGWFLDDLGVDQVLAGGACTPRPDPEPCKEIDDLDPAVEYRKGWHRREDPRASNGGYHRRMGSGGASSAVRVEFDGDEVTYFYVKSDRGGTADVSIDGVFVETLSYGPGQSGPENPTFGHARTYSALGSGRHELLIEHRTGAVYVDGFAFSCGDPAAGADPEAAESGSVTEAGTASSSEGLVIRRTVDVGPDDEHVSVVVEGSLTALTVRLLDPLGGLLATGGALLPGGAVSGVETDVAQPGTYRVEVLNVLGAFSQIEISTARTVRRP